ncbi:MAG: DEAD/DEAH box helicase [Gemmatimonadota bacterium]
MRKESDGTEEEGTGTPETFRDLGLSEELCEAVAGRGYVRPTPVQGRAIPPILEGRDVLGCAQTGTGKTAAFVLPMLQHLAERPEDHGKVRGLILTPTRELAGQVEEAVSLYGARLSIEPLVVYGGMPIAPQVRDLRFGCDVLVATPGRLLDHLRRGNVDLAAVRVLVLDEADRMLDMGFIDDVRAIVRATPRERQTLLFSATIPDSILSLAHEMMREPVRVQVGFQKSAEGITEVIHPVDYAAKHGLLLELLEEESEGQVLVFTRMRSTASYLTTFLKARGFAADDLHGDKSQAERAESLRRFRAGESRILVATNVAARGLDIAGITHVINFDVPDDPKDYLHRVGRTARADQTGDAITLMSPHEWLLVREIERLTGDTIPRRAVSGFEPSVRPPEAQADDAEPAEERPRSRLTRGRRNR